MKPWDFIVKSSSQFNTDALSREIDRRRCGCKVCSISKKQIETWIDKKMSADLKNEPMRDFIHIENGKRGREEFYGWVKFTDEIMERLYELYDLSK